MAGASEKASDLVGITSGDRGATRRERISPVIRVFSGIIGLLGFVAIAFNASQASGIQPDFMLFASFFAGFIFLYVAFFGTYPWDRKKH